MKHTKSSCHNRKETSQKYCDQHSKSKKAILSEKTLDEKTLDDDQISYLREQEEEKATKRHNARGHHATMYES